MRYIDVFLECKFRALEIELVLLIIVFVVFSRVFGTRVVDGWNRCGLFIRTVFWFWVIVVGLKLSYCY